MFDSRSLSLLCGLIAAFVPPLTHADGGGSTAGGDTVVCTQSPKNPLNGMYSLDYVLTLSKGLDNTAPAASLDISLDRIEKNLARTLPELSQKFREYRSHLFEEDYTANRVWIASPLELVDLKDEKMIRRLPENCRGKDLIQTVVREKKKNAIFYHYDSDAVDRLQKSAPVQASFLVVHEWLWDLTGDVEAIRRVNGILHSKSFEFKSDQEIQRAFSLLELGDWKTATQLAEEEKMSAKIAALPCRALGECTDAQLTEKQSELNALKDDASPTTKSRASAMLKEVNGEIYRRSFIKEREKYRERNKPGCEAHVKTCSTAELEARLRVLNKRISKEFDAEVLQSLQADKTTIQQELTLRRLLDLN